MTTTEIPGRILSAFRHALATVKAHHATRAEFVRVYGAERGRDEFRALPNYRSDRGPEAAATAREIVALAAGNGITAAELLAAARAEG